MACPVALCGACFGWFLMIVYPIFLGLSMVFSLFLGLFFISIGQKGQPNIYFVYSRVFASHIWRKDAQGYPVGDSGQASGPELVPSPPKNRKKLLTGLNI